VHDDACAWVAVVALVPVDEAAAALELMLGVPVAEAVLAAAVLLAAAVDANMDELEDTALGDSDIRLDDDPVEEDKNIVEVVTELLVRLLVVVIEDVVVEADKDVVAEALDDAVVEANDDVVEEVVQTPPGTLRDCPSSNRSQFTLGFAAFKESKLTCKPSAIVCPLSPEATV
jgi:hypothetical protein